MTSTARRARSFYLSLLLLFLVGLTPTWAKEYPGLAEHIDSLLADPALNHGIQGIRIESLEDGAVLYDRNSTTVLIPASNFKLLVSSCTLDRLGPNFRYRTMFYSTGEMDDKGVLRGDVILRGAGDPTLKTDDLRDLVKSLTDKGVKKIQGDVVGDDTLFDGQRLGWGWSWDDEPYYYSAQISALCLNENVIGIYVKPGQHAGAPAVVSLDPATDYMSVINTAVTGEAKSAKTVSVDRVRGRNIIRVTGSVPADYKPAGPEEAITVEEPALYAATVLRDLLARSGIEVTGKPRLGKTPDSAHVIDGHSSEPISTILSLLNKPSDNLIAEVLLKTLGAEIKGKGTDAAGAEVEREFLKSAGLDMEAVNIVDGSGLSRLDYISPANLVTLLKYMYHHRDASIYMNSLPIAGVDGTLRRRMKGTPAEGKVHAKSGYVSRVSTLSGYVTTKGGDELVFSIMMNNHLCRNTPAMAVQNRICEYLAGLE